MSGNVKIRKQWQFQDGPRGSLHRLRSQLAEDGCVESQLIVAKQLLEESRVNSEEGKSVTAVRWLMRAAKLANQEAIDILRECFNTGKGITKRNYEVVKCCLNMETNERQYCAAAHNIFKALTTSEDDYVTTNQLNSLIKSGNESNEKLLIQNANDCDNSSETSDNSINEYCKIYEFGGEHLTEEELVNIAAQISRGETPHYSLKDDVPEDSNNSTLKKFTAKACTYLKSSHEFILLAICKHSDKILATIFPTNQLQTLLLVLLCSFLTLDVITLLIPLVLFYSAFSLMVMTTLRMEQKIKYLDKFRKWTCLFRKANSGLDTSTSQNKYLKNCLWTYLKFFIAFVVVLLAMPHCTSDFIPYSELSALAFLLSFLSALCLNETWNATAIFHLILIIYSLLPAGQIEYFNFFSLECYGFDYSLTALIFPVIYVKMASENSWHGTYKVLLPNLGVLLWFRFAVLLYDVNSSALPTVKWLFLWSFLLLIPPVLFFFVGLWLLIFVIEYFYNSENLLTSLCIVLIIASIVLVKKFVLEKRLSSNSKWKKVATAIQIVCGLLVLMQLLPVWQDISFQLSDGKHISDLDWETYQNFCHEPAWKKESAAKVKATCSHLTGAIISWEGQVRQVSVASVQNKLEDVINTFPTPLGGKLRCILGTSFDDSCENLDGYYYEQCAVMAAYAPKRCHLKNWEKYYYEIVVQMSSGYWNSAEVALDAEHLFTNFAQQLHSGDVVHYTGSLGKDVGSFRPHVNLMSIKCTACMEKPNAVNLPQPVGVQQHWKTSIGFLLGFFFPSFITSVRENVSMIFNI